jgi:signal transduction histidine kinase
MAADLREAITLELELLREDVGTHAEITDVGLGNTVSAREALAVLRVVQELTATLAKRAEELRIDVQRDGDAAVVTVEAIGWADSTPHHGVLERGVTAFQGTLELRPGAQSLTAEVRIPDSAS